jgi:uncharacterized phage protein gp47/JayE
MTEIQHKNEEDIIEHWDHPIQPHESDNLYKLLEVLTSENKRIDIELDELYDNRFLDTATGTELEKMGDLVGVKRKNNESDPKLRKRIRGAFAAHASDTTYESFTSAAMSILEATPNTIDFITPPETPPKVIEAQLDSQVLEENPLTEDELIILLNGALSVDARLRIKHVGTFAFEGDNTSLEGWDAGTWSVAINE